MIRDKVRIVRMIEFEALHGKVHDLHCSGEYLR